MKEYEFKLNSKCLSLIENKRVVLVGPSNHLQGLKQGKLIDSYDVVARVNDYPQDDIEKDYGDRTDIVFDSCDSRINSDTLMKLDRFEERAKKIKVIIAHTIQATNGGPSDGVEVQENLRNNNIYNLDCWWIGIENYNIIKKIMGGLDPNSGMSAIMLMLLHNPKEFFITGISFYLQWKSDDFYNSIYRKNYNISPDIWTNYEWKNWNPQMSHDQISQIRFFENVLLKQFSDVIWIDSYLAKLLKITNYKHIIDIGK